MKSARHGSWIRWAASGVLALGLLGQPLMLQAACPEPVQKSQSCCCRGSSGCASACEGCDAGSDRVPPPEKAPGPSGAAQDQPCPHVVTAWALPAHGLDSASKGLFAPQSLPRGRPPSSLLLNATFLC